MKRLLKILDGQHGGDPRPERGAGGAAAGLALILFLFAVPAGAHVDPPIGLSHMFLHWEELAPLTPTWVRVNLHWGYFQPVDEPDTSRWVWTNDETSQLDSLFAHGYSALAVLRTGTVWANRGTASLPYVGPSYAPNDITGIWNPDTGYSASYHRFVEGLVRHYNGDGVHRRLKILAVENEMVTDSWWQGHLPGESEEEVANEYLRLLQTAYHAAKLADPGILVTDGALPSFAIGAIAIQHALDRGAPPDSVLEFANRFNARGFNITWGWPFHWPSYDSLTSDFAGRLRPLVAAADRRADVILSGMKPSDRVPEGEANLDLLNFHFYEPYWMLEPMLQLLRDHFGSTLPPMLTNELGNRMAHDPPGPSRLGGSEDWRPAYAAYDPCDFDDSEAAGYELIEKTVTTLAAGVSPVIWFVLDATEGVAGGEGEKLSLSLSSPDARSGFPITRRRPAYYAYAFLASMLSSGGGHALPVRDSSVPSSCHRYVFRDEETGVPDLEFLWWDDGSWSDLGLAARGAARLVLNPPEGATAVALYDDYLRPARASRVLVPEGGTVNIAVTERPVALRWEGPLAPVPPGTAPTRGSWAAAAPGDSATLRSYGFQDLVIGPSPSRNGTRIRFLLSRRTDLRVTLFDARGRVERRLARGPIGPGPQEFAWDGRADDGRDLPAGLYFLRIEFGPGAGDGCADGAPPPLLTRKIILVR